MKETFVEYFRCPSSFVDFRLAGPLQSRPGFFRFGPDSICFGRLSGGRISSDPESLLPDASVDARVEHDACFFPFDPDEVIQNLRYERYRKALPSAAWNGQSFVRATYYGIRPLLPIAVRKHLQRVALKRWRETPFPHWPVDQTVDRLFDKLMAAVLRATAVDCMPFIWFWPEGIPSASIMTHDVETASGRDFCERLMDIDDSFGIKSSFQIVPEERYEVPKSLLSLLRKRGFEINVHDINHDGNLFQDRQEFLRRAPRINAYAKEFGAAGYRSGVLYRNLEWYDSFDFSYDMSVPNAGHLEPQPGGCCTTKPFFIGNILELPVMATQDYSLYHILQSYSVDLWRQQIETVLPQNGLLSFIIHPDYLLDSRAQQTYTSLLAHLAKLRSEGRTWTALPGEINEWWRQRARMKLIEKDGEWTIVGQGSNRARLAYASMKDGAVSYSLAPRPVSSRTFTPAEKPVDPVPLRAQTAPQ
jgi:hypothetical protein